MFLSFNHLLVSQIEFHLPETSNVYKTEQERKSFVKWSIFFNTLWVITPYKQNYKIKWSNPIYIAQF